MAITTKAQMYREFHRGRFGNHGPMWDTLEEWARSGYRQPIAIRTRRRGGRCDYFIPRGDVRSRVASFLEDGYTAAELQFSAQAPEHRLLLQGEVCQVTHLEAFVALRTGLPMRQALAMAGRQLQGLEAISHLKWAMDAASYDWLQELLQRYPGHVIEFSSFSQPWGVLPGLNTVFWEVRAY